MIAGLFATVSSGECSDQLGSLSVDASGTKEKKVYPKKGGRGRSADDTERHLMGLHQQSQQTLSILLGTPVHLISRVDKHQEVHIKPQNH